MSTRTLASPRLAVATLGLATATATQAQSAPQSPLPASLPAGVGGKSMPGVRVGSVVLATGVRLEYAEAGSPDGEPVLFLHGITDSWFSYTRVLQRLPQDIRALVPSQRGHGDSDRPPCCYRIDDFAADAVAFLDALGIDRAAVVGHSMGSFVAQKVATTHPNRVTKLVLIGSGTTAPLDVVLEFQEAVRGLTDPVPQDFILEFQRSTLHRPVPEAFLQGVVAESGKLPARVWRDALAGIVAADMSRDLARIQVPTLIMWGDRDAFWRRDQQDGLLRLIAGARLEVYAETGHSPHWELPEQFVRDLERFLRAGG